MFPKLEPLLSEIIAQAAPMLCEVKVTEKKNLNLRWNISFQECFCKDPNGKNYEI